MTFDVEKIGKIRKASISIDGITVIAGPNGSGKSTIGRALMTWCSVLRQMPDVLIDERIKSAREAVDKILRANGIPSASFSFGSTRSERLKLLKPDTWLDVTTISEYLQEFPDYFFGDRDAKEDAEKIVSLKEDIVQALDDVSSRDVSFYIPTIIEDFFVSALDGEYVSQGFGDGQSLVLATLGESKVAHVKFNQGKAIDCKIVSSDFIPLVFYFEPLHLLDFYAQKSRNNGKCRLRLSAAGRYKAEDADWKNFLYDDVDRSSWSVERKTQQAEIDLELDELLSVIRGRLAKKDRELRFMDLDAEHAMSIMNVASGVKTMSVIEKGIRAGVIRPDSMLIIDEPESNLHPQWQIEFAHFLVKLNAKFGMRFLLNTHSPFFLKAIEVFTREEGCAAAAHYYYMEQEANEPGFVAKELENGTNEIFKTYFDALNDLMSR